MNTIDTKSSQVAYWTYGDSALQPLVMIHGFRGTHHGLELIAKRLSSEFYVIVPDLPGFGDSPAFSNQPHDLTGYTSFLADFIKHLNLSRRPYILGHSFGSIVVSSLVASSNDITPKLVLINPIGAPALEGPKAIMSRLALLYYRVGQALPSKLAHPWLAAKPIVWVMSRLMTKTRDKQLIKYIDEQHYTHFSRFSNSTSLSQAFETSISHNIREFAADIKIPTLMVVGEQDDITPLDKQRELAKLFPNVELKTIKDVGHLVHYETPDVAADYIRNFLQPNS